MKLEPGCRGAGEVGAARGLTGRQRSLLAASTPEPRAACLLRYGNAWTPMGEHAKGTSTEPSRACAVHFTWARKPGILTTF